MSVQHDHEAGMPASPLLEHAGYFGESWQEGGRFHIKVVNSRDFLHASCGGPDEAQGAFRDLVDDYLETCAAAGRSADRIERAAAAAADRAEDDR